MKKYSKTTKETEKYYQYAGMYIAEVERMTKALIKQREKMNDEIEARRLAEESISD